MASRRRLPRSFFRRPTLVVARELIGQRLVRLERGRRLSGWIIEAEAYIGQADLACHARSGLTARNRVMWGEAGHAYVYFTYGMHWCLNIVTEAGGRPAAVLLRALAPAEGLATMARRRGLHSGTLSLSKAVRRAGRRPQGDGPDGGAGRSDDARRASSGSARLRSGLTDGPAKLCQALAVDRRLNGHDLCAPEARLFVERGPAPRPRVVRSPRIGLDHVPEPWKSKPWRYRLVPEQISTLMEERA